VEGSCRYGDEPLGSGAMELVEVHYQIFPVTADNNSITQLT
jgi:hypothetical protein